MKITVTKIKRTLEKDYGWENLLSTCNEHTLYLIDELIKDTLKVVNKELISQKGISINGK